jgi:hypothetical protein
MSSCEFKIKSRSSFIYHRVKTSDDVLFTLINEIRFQSFEQFEVRYIFIYREGTISEEIITVFCFSDFIGIETTITSLYFSRSLLGKATDLSLMVILNNFKDLYNCYHINDY